MRDDRAKWRNESAQGTIGMMAAGIAMIVTGAGAAGLLWPASPTIALVVAPICAILSAGLVAPDAANGLRRRGEPDA